MADQSLLTDEIRALVGQATESREAIVSEEAVRRAVGVYGGDVPSLKEGGIVPGFVLTGLMPEGDNIRIPNLLPKSVLVSNEFAIERPLVLGERLMARSRIADISERLGGQFGHGLYVRSEQEFRGLDGEVVGRTASTLMHYDPAGAEERR